MSLSLHRVPRVLHRLQWKLTLSYALVTIAAIAVVGVAALAAMYIFPYEQDQYAGLLTEALESTASSAAPYFRGTLSDLEMLSDWLDGVVRSDEIHLGPGSRSRYVTVGKPLLVLVNDRGRVLGSTYPEVAPVNALISGRVSSDAASLLDAALAGRTNSGRLYRAYSNGEVMAAAPVFGETDQVVGAILLAFDRPQGIQGFLVDLKGNVRRYVGWVLLFAGVVGALFGSLMARGLTRRLFSVTEATTAWGRGDFGAIIHDGSADEIGHLSRQLNHMAEQLQNLLEAREQLATLEERNRLARDLHDSVTQAMYGVTLYAEAATRLLSAGDVEMAAQHLAELRATSQEALREMRLLIFELRPPVLQKDGLVAALQARLEAVEARAALQTELCAEPSVRLDPVLEEGLYRIAREALNNTLKHAQAHAICVSLVRGDASVSMEIRDDGCGFDPSCAGARRGMGLCSMEERARELGGELIVSSQPGTGTTVRVEVPL